MNQCNNKLGFSSGKISWIGSGPSQRRINQRNICLLYTSRSKCYNLPMLAEKIEISSPEKNPGLKSIVRYSWMDARALEQLVEIFAKDRVTAENHPAAICCCAGDAPEAVQLKELGWKDITCVDKYEPAAPLVDGVRWKYLNLGLLAQALKEGKQLPPGVEAMRESFDVVTMIQGFMAFDGYRSQDKVCKFFAKPDAIIFQR